MSHGWDEGNGNYPPHWQGEALQPEARRGGSGVVLALITLLAVLVLVLLGAVAYLFLRPGGVSGETPGQAAASSSSSSTSSSSRSTSSTRARVTETAYTTPPERETVTVTRPAPGTRSQQYGGQPAGADYSGWVSNSQARCNAGDPATMIGRTTQASFSICTNPDNGRYYYRGSADGAGVEVDDPAVSGTSATVRNGDVVYSIDSAGMKIYQGGALISSQPMINFWVG